MTLARTSVVQRTPGSTHDDPATATKIRPATTRILSPALVVRIHTTVAPTVEGSGVGATRWG
jgi:hypothetical protein